MRLLAFYFFHFGLGLIALLILLASAIHAKRVRTVLIHGVIAMILLSIECALSIFLAAACLQYSRPEIAQREKGIAFAVVIISLVSLAIYFPVAVSRAINSQRDSGGLDDAA